MKLVIHKNLWAKESKERMLVMFGVVWSVYYWCWHRFNNHCYIPRLALNRTSTEIGWFLVMCPWSNSNVSQLGYNCTVVACAPNTTVHDCFKGKFKYITKHLMYGPKEN